VAGVAPVFVSVPRGRIQAAGGQLFGGDLYFGDFLDLPPHTVAVAEAPRVLGLKLSGFEASLRHTFEWHQAQPRRPKDYALEDRLLDP